MLCEKPFALNYTQAKEMIELATEKHILLAEAMWMRYQPLAAKIVELINDGVIGKPRLLLANKGEADLAPEGLNPATGGSTLLNMGVYAINDAFLAFGSNVLNVSTSRIMLESGTDGANSITLEYPDGKLAILSSSLIAPTGNRWYICGENGMLEAVCKVLHNTIENVKRSVNIRQRKITRAMNMKYLRARKLY